MEDGADEDEFEFDASYFLPDGIADEIASPVGTSRLPALAAPAFAGPSQGFSAGGLLPPADHGQHDGVHGLGGAGVLSSGLGSLTGGGLRGAPLLSGGAAPPFAPFPASIGGGADAVGAFVSSAAPPSVLPVGSPALPAARSVAPAGDAAPLSFTSSWAPPGLPAPPASAATSTAAGPAVAATAGAYPVSLQAASTPHATPTEFLGHAQPGALTAPSTAASGTFSAHGAAAPGSGPHSEWAGALGSGMGGIDAAEFLPQSKLRTAGAPSQAATVVSGGGADAGSARPHARADVASAGEHLSDAPHGARSTSRSAASSKTHQRRPAAGTNKPNSGARANSESNPGARARSESNSGVRAKSDSNSGVRAKSDSISGARAKSDSNSGVRGKSDSNSGVRGKSDSNSGARAKSQSNPGARAKSEAKSASHPKPGAKPGARVKAEVKPKGTRKQEHARTAAVRSGAPVDAQQSADAAKQKRAADKSRVAAARKAAEAAAAAEAAKQRAELALRSREAEARRREVERERQREAHAKGEADRLRRSREAVKASSATSTAATRHVTEADTQSRASNGATARHRSASSEDTSANTASSRARAPSEPRSICGSSISSDGSRSSRSARGKQSAASAAGEAAGKPQSGASRGRKSTGTKGSQRKPPMSAKAASGAGVLGAKPSPDSEVHSEGSEASTSKPGGGRVAPCRTARLACSACQQWANKAGASTMVAVLMESVLSMFLVALGFPVAVLVGVLFAVGRAHKHALFALFYDVNVAFTFGFLVVFPRIVTSIIPWAPPWAPIILWYAFLVQLFCVHGPMWSVVTARIVVPLMFLVEGVSAHSFLLDLRGSELLLMAYLVASMKLRHLLSPLFVCGLGFQVAFVLLPCNLLTQWCQAMLGLVAIKVVVDVDAIVESRMEMPPSPSVAEAREAAVAQ